MKVIHEVIITSLSADGVPKISPFGVRFCPEGVWVSPYRPSTTLSNILAMRQAVLNVTDDVRVFAGALTSRYTPALLPTKTVVGVRLADALSYQELELLEVRDDAVRPELLLRVVNEGQQGRFLGFNRAQAAVVELAVLASRLHLLPREKVLAEQTYLSIALQKTTGDREQEAWAWLEEKIQRFYTRQDT